MATGRRTIGAHTRSGDHTHTLELIPPTWSKARDETVLDAGDPGERYASQRKEHHAKNLVGNCVSSWQNNRPPEFTVLCRSVERIWFLLRRGQFHLSRSTQASAVLSTGVSTLRRTAGEFA
jgi:hypothetical protein